MSYPRSYPPSSGRLGALDWNAMVDRVNGFTPSGVFVSPYSYCISFDGTDYYASNAFQTVYGGPSDEGGVDGADLAAVVQACLDDLTTGGYVQFGPGIFYTDDTFKMRYDNTRIGGSGVGVTKIVQTTANKDIIGLYGPTTTFYERLTVDNVYLDCATNDGGSAISWYNTDHGRIYNVYMSGGSDVYSLFLQGTYGSTDADVAGEDLDNFNSVQNCTIWGDWDGDNTSLSFQQNLRFINNHCYGRVAVYKCRDSFISNNTVESHDEGIWATGPSYNLAIVGNTVEAVDECIVLSGTGTYKNWHPTIIGNTVRDGLAGIVLNYVIYGAIAGNTIQGSSLYGIKGNPVNYSTITANSIEDIASGGGGACIQLGKTGTDYSNYNTVTANTIYGDSTLYGIIEETVASDQPNVITDNIIQNCTNPIYSSNTHGSIVGRNVGFITEIKGNQAVANGETTKQFAHGLESAPIWVQLSANYTGADPYVTSVDATNINIAFADPLGDKAIYWHAGTRKIG